MEQHVQSYAALSNVPHSHTHGVYTLLRCAVLCCVLCAAASTEAPEMGNFFQRQAMAVPADISDPLLKKWVKPDTNPFLVQVCVGAQLVRLGWPPPHHHNCWQCTCARV